MDFSVGVMLFPERKLTVLLQKTYWKRLDPLKGEGCPFCGVSETNAHVYAMFLSKNSLWEYSSVKELEFETVGYFSLNLLNHGPKYSVYKKHKVIILNVLYGINKLGTKWYQENKVKAKGGWNRSCSYG